MMKIKLENITKVFGKNDYALKGVNMEFNTNTITGLIGFNGSGKTTTFNILTKFIEDYDGIITFDGKKINKYIKSQISFLSTGSEQKNPVKALKHLLQIAALYQIPKKEAKKIIYKLASQVDLVELKKPIKKLSKGNQQKIKFISTFLNPHAKIFFLDEPFDGLDPIAVNKIKKIFMELKDATIIITSHRMEVVQEMCEEFYILKNGKVLDKKKIDKAIILVAINKEISIEKIKKIQYITNIKETNKEILLEIKNIDDFKKLNKEIIQYENFKWCTLKEKNIAESVFERYNDD